MELYVQTSDCTQVFYGYVLQTALGMGMGTPNLPTNIMDFGGFDSRLMLSLKGGILMSIGKLPESLSQAMLVGVILVYREIWRISRFSKGGCSGNRV